MLVWVLGGCLWCGVPGFVGCLGLISEFVCDWAWDWWVVGCCCDFWLDLVLPIWLYGFGRAWGAFGWLILFCGCGLLFVCVAGFVV